MFDEVVSIDDIRLASDKLNIPDIKELKDELNALQQRIAPVLSIRNVLDEIETSIQLKGSMSFKEFSRQIAFLGLLHSGVELLKSYRMAYGDYISPDETCRQIATKIAGGKLAKRLHEKYKVSVQSLFIAERIKSLYAMSKIVENERNYAKDRIAAANVLLTHTAPPAESVVTHEAGESMVDYQSKVLEHLKELSKKQKDAIDAGGDLKKVQKLDVGVIDVSAE